MPLTEDVPPPTADCPFCRVRPALTTGRKYVHPGTGIVSRCCGECSVEIADLIADGRGEEMAMTGRGIDL